VSLVERHTGRSLDHPVLVVAMEGWVDAGFGAAGAVGAMLAAGQTELVATFDTEELLDHRARRPVAHIDNGINEGLSWPSIEVRAGRDLLGREVCFLIGPEPDFHWRSFVAATVGLARDLEVRMAVGLGAFPAPAPHTRPVRLAATAPAESSDLSRSMGVIKGEIEVPSGIWGPLELAFGAAGIPAVGLWARVPHYVSAMAFPPASAALVAGLSDVSGLAFDVSTLSTAGDTALRQVDDLISRSEEHADMVRSLEHSIDEAEGNTLDIGQVPTGDEIAAELERYLRSQRAGDDGDTSDEGEYPDDGDTSDEGEYPDDGDTSDEGEYPDDGDTSDEGW
jgi:hypothetical protein